MLIEQSKALEQWLDLTRTSRAGRHGADLYIEFARGKVPLRAHRDGGLRRTGCLVLSQGALLIGSQKVFANLWKTKENEKRGKGSQKGAKGSQKEAKGSPSGNKKRPKCI